MKEKYRMVALYILLIPLFLVSLWIFFRFIPKIPKAIYVTMYNIATIVIMIVTCWAYGFYLYKDMSKGSDSGWWPVITFIFSLVISIIILSISFVFRNFVIFRKH